MEDKENIKPSNGDNNTSSKSIKSSGGGASDARITSNAINESFIITDIPTKTTASKSIIVFGKYTLNGKTHNVFGKFYITDPIMSGLDTRGIEYEQRVYKYIADKEKENPEISNYLIGSIKDYTENINLFHLLSDSVLSSKLDDEIKKLLLQNSLRTLVDIKTLLFRGFLIVKNNFINLKNIIQKFKFKFANLIEILFELLYSIHIMKNELRIMHNDLHWENIFIEFLQVPIENYHYNYGNITLVKTKKLHVKIFDNDLNYVEVLGNNKYLDPFFCESFGSCNHMSKKDLYIILTRLYFNGQAIINRINEINFNMILEIFANGFNLILLEKIIFANKSMFYCNWRSALTHQELAQIRATSVSSEPRVKAKIRTGDIEADACNNPDIFNFLDFNQIFCNLIIQFNSILNFTNVYEIDQIKQLRTEEFLSNSTKHSATDLETDLETEPVKKRLYSHKYLKYKTKYLQLKSQQNIL